MGERVALAVNEDVEMWARVSPLQSMKMWGPRSTAAHASTQEREIVLPMEVYAMVYSFEKIIPPNTAVMTRLLTASEVHSCVSAQNRKTKYRKSIKLHQMMKIYSDVIC